MESMGSIWDVSMIRGGVNKGINVGSGTPPSYACRAGVATANPCPAAAAVAPPPPLPSPSLFSVLLSLSNP
ncbi:hypothetical protein EJ110_NYTH09651 [Nymphaea thermarum]|nr:hypothetical protein EJ110_NYTH09651 [Nymphaea thermarum]